MPLFLSEKRQNTGISAHLIKNQKKHSRMNIEMNSSPSDSEYKN